MNLQDFIQAWKQEYAREALKLPLFTRKEWGEEERKKFILLFYHARGHFDRFLWVVGSFASNEEQKEVVLANIKDEFGGGRKSHEQLYFDFGLQFGLDLMNEMLDQNWNLDFVEGFNQGHINWLGRHGANHRWAAFSAYEALDNIDYENLYQLAVTLGASGSGLTFFSAHRTIGHYDVAKSQLQSAWKEDPEAVKSGFEFIGDHQLELWRNLGKKIFG